MLPSVSPISGCCADDDNRVGGGSGKKKPLNVDRCLRDYFNRTNLDLFLIGLFFTVYSSHYATQASEVSDSTGGQELDGAATTLADRLSENSTVGNQSEFEQKESSSDDTVLFPWFAQIIGVLIYYFLSRYVHSLPYTAVMFVIGFAMGFSMVRHNGSEDILRESWISWMNIPGQLLLAVFLPGLLYIDAYHIDVHLFINSFMQLLLLAFPMVLAGTAITACVAYYIFPFGWNLDLCFTFGSILSATDPVAVAVLLNELGGPPRLKMHISGEALLNDGSAYVFYTIFSARYFFTFGIPDVGQDVNWGEGFKLFFQLAIGGMCIGLAFGVASVIMLYALNRRLSGEDSLAQVVVTITASYLSYFTSEVAGCSGIIAVLFLGVTVKSLGFAMINDPPLMMHFWEVIEWLLNTLLFTLAGCLWGNLIGDDKTTKVTNDALLSGTDWAYLILLFVLLNVIRFVLIFSFYPIISKIGVGSSFQEAIFMSWAGLRGAVGIALAISLRAEVWQLTDEMNEIEKVHARIDTDKAFGFVGGIALLTLIVNAPLSGPLLKKLGLVTPTETRLQMVENYKRHMSHFCLMKYVAILAESRFEDLDYMVVKEHVPFLKEITYEQLEAALQEHQGDTPSHAYVPPDLKNLNPYLKKGDMTASLVAEKRDKLKKKEIDRLKHHRSVAAKMKLNEKAASKRFRNSVVGAVRSDNNHALELRIVFVNALRSMYAHLIEMGELESRSFIAYSLNRSLDYVIDSVSRGFHLNDWEALQVASQSILKYSETALYGLLAIKHQIKNRTLFRFDRASMLIRMRVREALVFIKGHEMAKEALTKFCRDVAADRDSVAESTVLQECDAQIQLAQDALKEVDEVDLQQIKSHHACHILLNSAAHFLQTLSDQGLITEGEAVEIFEEIEDHIHDVKECQKLVHVGEYTSNEKISFSLKNAEDPATNLALDDQGSSGDLDIEVNVQD